MFSSTIKQMFIQARPLSQVPLWIKLALLVMLLAQLGWHALQSPVAVQAEQLPSPDSVAHYRLMSLNEPLATAKFLNLWLQAFDNQPGISLSFQQLDYDLLTQWLDTILALDNETQYPMLVASHIYGSVSNKQKKRQMMDYVQQKFTQHPDKYWRWLAHAVIVAKHELKDMPLALQYANTLAEQVELIETVPYWAKDLRIIVLEDMGELEAAKILVGGLIEGGDITDPYEIRFLVKKLSDLEQKLMKPRQDVEKSTKDLP